MSLAALMMLVGTFMLLLAGAQSEASWRSFFGISRSLRAAFPVPDDDEPVEGGLIEILGGIDLRNR